MGRVGAVALSLRHTRSLQHEVADPFHLSQRTKKGEMLCALSETRLLRFGYSAQDSVPYLYSLFPAFLSPAS